MERFFDVTAAGRTIFLELNNEDVFTVLSPGVTGETDPFSGPASGRSILHGRMIDTVYSIFMGNRS